MSTPTNNPYGQQPAAQPPAYAPPAGYGAQQLPAYGSIPPVPQQPGHAAPYAAPWTAPSGDFAATLNAPPARRSRTLGRVAFVLGLIAAVIAPVLIAIGYAPIAPLLLEQLDRGADPAADLMWLAPVAGSELLAEVAFSVGTIAGIAGIVAGIIAAAQRRGRAWGVWGIVLSILGPVIVGAVLFFQTIVAVMPYAN